MTNFETTYFSNPEKNSKLPTVTTTKHSVTGRQLAKDTQITEATEGTDYNGMEPEASFQSVTPHPSTQDSLGASSATHPGTSGPPFSTARFHPEFVTKTRNVPTRIARGISEKTGRKDTQSNRTPALEGFSIQEQTRQHSLATPGPSIQSSVDISSVQQLGASGFPFVNPPYYHQGIMYPPTAVVTGVQNATGSHLHSAQGTGALAPFNVHPTHFHPTGYNNGQYSLLSRQGNQAGGPYIDNRQYITSKFIFCKRKTLKSLIVFSCI